MKEIFTMLVIVAWVIVVWVIGAPLVVTGITSLADGPTRVVQGVSSAGPVCMQAKARDVVEADGLCIVGTGDTSVIVHYCWVSP